MSTVADTLITRFQLQDHFSGPAKKVADATSRVTKGIGVASSAAKTSAASVGRLSKAVSGIAAGVAAAIPIIGVGLATAVMATEQAVSSLFDEIKSASGAAADFDSLVMSLEAVEGGAKGAQSALKDLKKLAAAPGLGFEEAVRAYTSLRNSDIGADFSKELIKQIANANARSGGNRESFGRAMLATSQIAGSEFLQGDELNQFQEAGIPARKLIKDVFGTADTEQLKKDGVTARAVLAALTLELQKQDRVAGGTRNAFDNLDDAIKFARVEVGKSLNVAFRPMAETLGNIVDIASRGGVFKSIGDDMARIFAVDTGKFENFFINMIAAFKTGLQFAGMIVEQLSKIFPWLSGSAAGVIGSVLDPLFQNNRAIVAGQMQSGKASQAAEGQFMGGTYDMLIKYLENQARERSYTKQTAENTERLVQISTDLSRSQIGGGTIGQQQFSPVRIGKTLAGDGGSRVRRAVNELVEAIEREAFRNIESIVANRGVPTERR